MNANIQISQNEQTITLIGAGLVGSLLAVFLARKGIRVDIYERRPDMRKETISAGRSINLALANRGIYPLEQAGLMAKIRPMLTTMKGRMVHDLEGSQNFQSYGQKPEEVIYSISRGDLNCICMDAAEQTGLVNIYFNQVCEAVDLENNHIVLQHSITSGEIQIEFNRVIGTDGSASAVRKAIHKVESIQHDILDLGHCYKELHIPPDENGNFQIDPDSLHIWPRGGFMMIALPNRDASFTVTLFMPKEGEISFDTLDTSDKLNDFFLTYFKTALPLLPNLAEEFFDNPTGNLATVKCSPWYYKDKALLLGDAAHAVVPFHGQGMNCGFEDAQDLSATIDLILSDNNKVDWQTIFETVDKNRKINGDAIADMAIENYVTMRDSVRDEVFLLKSALAFELEKRFPDYFCPRYSMVMFHRLPYAEAKSRGQIQEQILSLLTQDVLSIDEVDFVLAELEIKQQLSPVDLNPRN